MSPRDPEKQQVRAHRPSPSHGKQKPAGGGDEVQRQLQRNNHQRRHARAHNATRHEWLNAT
eukprot:3263855-Pyramimonas_sp.AAC.1